ncbi:MAG TPA: chitosanase [bacterium]|nr:chitosanase [bacterium]
MHNTLARTLVGLSLFALPSFALAQECPQNPSRLPDAIDETNAWCPTCSHNALETLDASVGAASALSDGVQTDVETMLNMVRSEETGSATPDYGSITVDSGGLTYGAYQFDSYSGSLRTLLKRYAANGGAYAHALQPYLDQMNRGGYPHGSALQDLLHKAAKDPVMGQTQDEVYTSEYVQPAMQKAADMGIRSPAGAALVLDIYTNGGLSTIVRQAKAQVPSIKTPGDETRFLQAMLDARDRYYRHLGANGYGRYLKGWLGRNNDYRTMLAKYGLGLEANGKVYLPHAGTRFCTGDHADARAFGLYMAALAQNRDDASEVALNP